MKALKYIMYLFVFLLFVNCKTDREYVLIKGNSFSEEGLRKWNAATVAALDSFAATYGVEYKDKDFVDWLNTPKEDSILGLRREKYFDLLRESKVVADSIPYNSIYIVEMYLYGERVSIEKYLIIHYYNSSHIYFTEILEGGWVPIWSTRTNDDRLSSFFEDVPPSIEDMKHVGVSLIISKITGEKVVTKVYDKLLHEHYHKLLQMLPHPDDV